MSAIFCLLFALLFFIVSYFQYAITACIFPHSSVQTLPRTAFFSALQTISRLPPDRHRQWCSALWRKLKRSILAVFRGCALDSKSTRTAGSGDTSESPDGTCPPEKKKGKRRAKFLPMPNMFEVFGFDFLLTENGAGDDDDGDDGAEFQQQTPDTVEEDNDVPRVPTVKLLEVR